MTISSRPTSLPAPASSCNASEEENADLLWGLRGGGGNFGIVTNFVFRVHPVSPMCGGVVVHPLSAARDLFRFYRDHYDAAPPELGLDAGLGISPEDGSPFAAFILVYNGPVAEGERVVAPFRACGTPLMDTCGPTTYTQVQTLFDATAPTGIPNYWKSTFLKELADGAIDAVVDSFERAPSRHAQMLFEGVGGAMNGVAREATAFDHREAKFNFFVVAAWEDRAEDEANISWARSMWDGVQKHAYGGVYANYLDEGHDKIEQAFGPGKYERLVALKDRYDPINLFRLNQNIAPRSVRRRSFDVGRLARGRRRGGILARVWTSGPPDSGMEIPDRKAGTEEIRVSYAVDGHCAPRSKCVGRSAPASAVLGPTRSDTSPLQERGLPVLMAVRTEPWKHNER